ncbi:MAG: putative sialic acid transporter [Planctomycetota bacterium]
MTTEPWYRGVTRYQWTVLLIASLGWVFDAFEGQLYNITRSEMLPELLQRASEDPLVRAWGDRLLGVFLLGGTLGGWLFSSLADRWGRRPVMALTILFYSIFSGLTAFATDILQIGVLRFLVAMGVGGEWAVGAALVAEVFPARARARAGGIFHASSVGGLWLAAAAGLATGSEWRHAYLLGIIPALLCIWVRIGIEEPESWREARRTQGKELGSFRALLSEPQLRLRAIGGALLAMIGLATFWGVVVAGQDLTKELLIQKSDPGAGEKSQIAFGFVQTCGAGLGMLAFGPLSSRLGTRRTFAIMHLGAALMTPIICWLPFRFGGYPLMLTLLPIFGFFAQGIHAGYAISFPALFPSHLRATGAGFCFNTGRILAAPMLIWGSAELKRTLSIQPAVTLLGLLFLFALPILKLLPEADESNPASDSQ